MIAEDDAISCIVLKKTVESLGTGLLKDAPSGVPRTNLPIILSRRYYAPPPPHHRTGAMRTSENPLKAKFAKQPF